MSSMSFLHVILVASDQNDTWLFEAQLSSLQRYKTASIYMYMYIMK